MKFGEVDVEDAVGAYLAHTTRCESATFKKGRHLSDQDCDILNKSGIQSIVVARLEEGDIHEDEAAERIAKSISAQWTELSPAHTGRCNIIANTAGLIRVDENAINRLNAVHESATIATLADLSAVRPGQVIATVKIIPFAISSDTMARVHEVTADLLSVVSVSPFQSMSVVVVNTRVPSLKKTVVEKTTALTRQRVASVGSSVDTVLECDHSEPAVAEAIKKAFYTKPDLIIVVGASVTVDREDVVPAGIVMSGGRVVHFGMPVDPGNLMLLAECGNIPAVVLPGCARSPKLNGIDWVLQRLAAGIKIDSADIMAMGVGGLLVDSPVRPLPRDEAVRMQDPLGAPPRVGAVVLAAGQSRRMGGANKLLEPIDGVPLIHRTVTEVIAAASDSVVVVTGHQPDLIEQALEGLNYSEAHNPDFADGLSSSLRVGLDALPSGIDGAIVCLGDMPSVSCGHIDALIAGFDPENGKSIGVPVHKGKRGNPVLWARRFFSPMTEIQGDVGARHLIGDHEDLVYEVEFGDTAVLTDLDTPEAWELYRSTEAD